MEQNNQQFNNQYYQPNQPQQPQQPQNNETTLNKYNTSFLINQKRQNLQLYWKNPVRRSHTK